MNYYYLPILPASQEVLKMKNENKGLGILRFFFFARNVPTPLSWYVKSWFLCGF